MDLHLHRVHFLVCHCVVRVRLNYTIGVWGDRYPKRPNVCLSVYRRYIVFPKFKSFIYLLFKIDNKDLENTSKQLDKEYVAAAIDRQ